MWIINESTAKGKATNRGGNGLIHDERTMIIKRNLELHPVGSSVTLAARRVANGLIFHKDLKASPSPPSPVQGEGGFRHRYLSVFICGFPFPPGVAWNRPTLSPNETLSQ